MKDEEVTETNVARLSRSSINRQRGDLPSAPTGSLAEQFGYSADEGSGAEPKGEQRLGTVDLDTKREQRRALDMEARIAWLEWRRTGIGASDIATILGWGYGSPYRLWAIKVGLIPAGDADDNELFEYGHRAEPMLRTWFQDRTGLYVANEQERRTHRDHPWVIATIDGEVYDHPVADSEHGVPLGGIEFKTATIHGWRADDPIPDHYQAQGQWQMLVCGWERVWFAVLHGHAFRVYGLDADADDQRMLLERASAFWHDHVLTLDPPPIDSSAATAKSLLQAYPGREGGSTAWLPDMSDVLGSLREAQEQAHKWRETVALYQNQLKEAMGDATDAEFGRGVEVRWSRFKRASIDTKALKARYPEAYDECARLTPTSRFTVLGGPDGDEDT